MYLKQTMYLSSLMSGASCSNRCGLQMNDVLLCQKCVEMHKDRNSSPLRHSALVLRQCWCFRVEWWDSLTCGCGSDSETIMSVQMSDNGTAEWNIVFFSECATDKHFTPSSATSSCPFSLTAEVNIHNLKSIFCVILHTFSHSVCCYQTSHWYCEVAFSHTVLTGPIYVNNAGVSQPTLRRYFYIGVWMLVEGRGTQKYISYRHIDDLAPLCVSSLYIMDIL